MLGIALARREETLFGSITSQLGSQIGPFSADFMQAQAGSVKIRREVTSLLELALKASLIAQDLNSVENVIYFAKQNGLIISIDEETVFFVVK